MNANFFARLRFPLTALAIGGALFAIAYMGRLYEKGQTRYWPANDPVAFERVMNMSP